MTYHNPNLSFERKTRAFNPYLDAAVALISMFAISLLVFVFHLMIVDIADIESTLIIQYGTPMLVGIMLFLSILAIIKGILWLRSLLASYKFEGNKIIRGYNQYEGDETALSLGVQAAGVGMMASNIGDRRKVNMARSALLMLTVFRKIFLNLNQDYVRENFDTDRYRKKEFANPRLIKEKKYFLVFATDNGRLKIPKIYPGLCQEPENHPKGMIKRIVLRSMAVLAIFMMLSFADLYVGAAYNTAYKSNIAFTWDQVCEALSPYGYAPHEFLEHRLVRDEGERSSQISYRIDKNGRVKDVTVDIYLSSYTSRTEAEIRSLITTLSFSFDGAEVDQFLHALKRSLEGEFTYYKMVSKDGKKNMRISLSGGYVQVYTRDGQ